MKTQFLAIVLALGAAAPSLTFAQQPSTGSAPTARQDPSQDGHGQRRRQRRERRRQHRQRRHDRGQRQHPKNAEVTTFTSVEFGAF